MGLNISQGSKDQMGVVGGSSVGLMCLMTLWIAGTARSESSPAFTQSFEALEAHMRAHPDFWGLKDASFLDNSEALDKQNAATDDDADEQIQHLKHQMLGDSIEGRWPAPPRPRRRRKKDKTHERQGKKLEKKWNNVVNVWHKMDKDDNDKITKKEFIRIAGKRHSSEFKSMDSDHNGTLNFNEFKKNFRLMKPKHVTKAAGKTKKQLDFLKLMKQEQLARQKMFEAGERVGEEKEVGKDTVAEIGEAVGEGSMTAEERAFRLEDQKEERASEARAKIAAKKVQAAIKKIKQ